MSDPYEELVSICHEYGAILLAVSKTRTEKEILSLYNKGQRVFGENRAHELIIKASLLPTEIEWHLIGHLQTNKIKSIIPYATLIQSLDRWKLWEKIQEEALEADKKVKCLLQIKIATENSKQGWDFEELIATLESGHFQDFSNVSIEGVMGMASLTSDSDQVREEFKTLKGHFDMLRDKYFKNIDEFRILSMGMSGDYRLALEEGSNMIRIGSLLFS